MKQYPKISQSTDGLIIISDCKKYGTQLTNARPSTSTGSMGTESINQRSSQQAYGNPGGAAEVRTAFSGALHKFVLYETGLGKSHC